MCAFEFRSHRIDPQIAAVSRFPPALKYKNPREREPCPVPPPPPPPPPKDSRLFWGTISLLIATGAFAVYAKGNPELRDWITIHAPWFDDFIAAAYRENVSYKELAIQLSEDMKKAVNKYLKNDKPKQCSTDGKPVPTVEFKPDESNEPDDEDDEGDYVQVSLSDVEGADEEETSCDKLPPPILTKNICEIEYCLKDLGDTVFHNYMTARDACIYYNKLVEETMVKFSIKGLKELHEAMAERIALVKESLGYATAAAAKLDDLSRYFECGVQAPKLEIDNAKDMMKEYRDRIKTVKMQYEWENDKALVVDVQWQKVEATIDKYIEENQTMFSGLQFDSNKPTLSGDPDLFLHHTLRYIKSLRSELLETVNGMSERVNRAMDTLPQGEKQKKARQSEIQYAFAKRKAELDKEYRKRFEDQRAANNKLLKDSLQMQLIRHQENMQTKLREKECEAWTKLRQCVAERAAAEKKIMAKQIYEMEMKLKMVEEKLNARLKAERETRRSQELWTAGASLLAATKKGDPYVNVDKELRAIEKASGDGDKLVQTVLKAIPNSVREKGVIPESQLKHKYRVMETTAMKVALVEQDGAPLPVYLISLLQYMFLFMKLSGIPQEEYEKPPKVPSKDLDTFDLLQRARFWMERGNIAMALRYISSLQGASRAAAASWREAAREHLETRQAAEAVIAHATALGLQYV